MHVVCTCEIPMLTYTSYTHRSDRNSAVTPWKLARLSLSCRALSLATLGQLLGWLKYPDGVVGMHPFVHHLTCRLFTLFGNMSNMYIKLCIYIYDSYKMFKYIFLEILRDVLWIYWQQTIHPFFDFFGGDGGTHHHRGTSKGLYHFPSGSWT